MIDDKKMKKFVLYTARFGMGGGPQTPKISIPDVDRFCFTDTDIRSNFYQIRKIKVERLTSIRRQRKIKICIPDEIFDNYEYSVYVDGKRRVVIDFEWFLSQMKPHSDFVTRKHKRRDCIYDEGNFCIRRGKDNKEIILKQLEFYGSENYPVHNGLAYSFIILRRHTKRMREFSKLWWEQLMKYSFRDQISLPYVAWKHNVKLSLCGRPE